MNYHRSSHGRRPYYLLVVLLLFISAKNCVGTSKHKSIDEEFFWRSTGSNRKKINIERLKNRKVRDDKFPRLVHSHVHLDALEEDTHNVERLLSYDTRLEGEPDPEVMDTEVMDTEVMDAEVTDAEVTDPKAREPELMEPELMEPEARTNITDDIVYVDIDDDDAIVTTCPNDSSVMVAEASNVTNFTIDYRFEMHLSSMVTLNAMNSFVNTLSKKILTTVAPLILNCVRDGDSTRRKVRGLDEHEMVKVISVDDADRDFVDDQDICETQDTFAKSCAVVNADVGLTVVLDEEASLDLLLKTKNDVLATIKEKMEDGTIHRNTVSMISELTSVRYISPEIDEKLVISVDDAERDFVDDQDMCETQDTFAKSCAVVNADIGLTVVLDEGASLDLLLTVKNNILAAIKEKMEDGTIHRNTVSMISELTSVRYISPEIDDKVLDTSPPTFSPTTPSPTNSPLSAPTNNPNNQSSTPTNIPSSTTSSSPKTDVTDMISPGTEIEETPKEEPKDETMIIQSNVEVNTSSAFLWFLFPVGSAFVAFFLVLFRRHRKRNYYAASVEGNFVNSSTHPNSLDLLLTVKNNILAAIKEKMEDGTIHRNTVPMIPELTKVRYLSPEIDDKVIDTSPPTFVSTTHSPTNSPSSISTNNPSSTPTNNPSSTPTSNQSSTPTSNASSTPSSSPKMDVTEMISPGTEIKDTPKEEPKGETMTVQSNDKVGTSSVFLWFLLPVGFAFVAFSLVLFRRYRTQNIGVLSPFDEKCDDDAISIEGNFVNSLPPKLLLVLFRRHRKRNYYAASVEGNFVNSLPTQTPEKTPGSTFHVSTPSNSDDSEHADESEFHDNSIFDANKVDTV
eukprot:CAMPEP_0195539492 /NCGR_PEP_ID=MMETSP0794_2-20130614/50078_1 /TAXON_ID=515487 /ORGANISM="Stephanopyxis turris, Strain CCMP 815" /LENGTH=847 /DNA_ID=CAMNT_0040673525 /DNA_START=87 /DNA_END=2631 /DNA_ORIENTATION=-